MKFLFVVDGRSPTAVNWISYFIQNGDEVHLVSSFPCDPIVGLASFRVIPLAFSQVQGEGKLAGKSSFLRKALPVGMRTRLRQWLAPMTLSRGVRALRIAINEVRPDLLHAMRIPYEGMLAAMAHELAGKDNVQPVIKRPLVLSVWGNDFTLHASSTHRMADLTRRALRQANALHTDCLRDQKLAVKWGYEGNKPAIVLPGGGGIRMEVFHPDEKGIEGREAVVINPRGFRAYVRNDTFFQAIPWVLERLPETRFLCPTMQREPQAHKWTAAYGIGNSVELLPFQNRHQMAELYRQAGVAVSLTTHDGTPNTLLEAMACGCFPIVGDLESLREWIRHGENGLLVDPGDPRAIAEAIVMALSELELRTRAAEINKKMILERAEYGQVMQKAQEFYASLIKDS